MTALLRTKGMGDGPPPFIILNSLINLPPELQELKDFRACWFPSASKGWITHYLFNRWGILFTQWCAEYQLRLPLDLAAQAIILVAEGHNSRENVEAMSTFRKANIRVITLPPHLTHVL
jgi:hypothetical protein